MSPFPLTKTASQWCKENLGDNEMGVNHTARGFEYIQFEDHYSKPFQIQQSSACLDINSEPGSTFLWVGPHVERGHLSRSQVADLVEILSNWLETGKLK